MFHSDSFYFDSQCIITFKGWIMFSSNTVLVTNPGHLLPSSLDTLLLLNLVPHSRVTPWVPLSPDFLLGTTQEEPSSRYEGGRWWNQGFHSLSIPPMGLACAKFTLQWKGMAPLKMALSIWLYFWLTVTMTSLYPFLLTGGNRQFQPPC